MSAEHACGSAVPPREDGYSHVADVCRCSVSVQVHGLDVCLPGCLSLGSVCTQTYLRGEGCVAFAHTVISKGCGPSFEANAVWVSLPAGPAAWYPRQSWLLGCLQRCSSASLLPLPRSASAPVSPPKQVALNSAAALTRRGREGDVGRAEQGGRTDGGVLPEEP